MPSPARKCLSLVVAVACVGAAPAPAAAPPGDAVASAHPLATRAGLDILRTGGNAFDAAVAVSAVLGVVEPFSSGFGGGGFWLLHRAADGRQVMLDGRETAPSLVHRRMYFDQQGEVIKDASLSGPLAAAIPGMPAALVHLSEHYGNLPLSAALAPAAGYARRGFKVTSRYHRMASYRAAALRQFPSAAAVFLQDGNPPNIGYLLRQEALADTIEIIARKGRAGFYEGAVAHSLVQASRALGGAWIMEDLRDYRVIERQPLVARYRDATIVSAPLPSSGGIVLSQSLKMLERFDLDGMSGVQRKHHIVEAMRRAYRDRAVFLGDPAFADVPVKRLLAPPYLEGLAMTINPRQATPSRVLGEVPALPQAGTQTTHFSILDREGNRVAGTLSINTPFGAAYIAGDTGILLNNEMDDFAIKPRTPNAYGLIGGKANEIEPGKRPLSSMTPTFLEAPGRVGVLGTPGGSRIISMLLLAALDFVDGGLPRSWVSLRRFHHQYYPDQLQYEQYGLTEHERRGLAALGHELREIPRRYGNMHAILWDKKENRLYAASDPRGEGLAEVVDR